MEIQFESRQRPSVDELLKRPTISPEEALEIVPVSRATMYAALKEGEIESFRIGKRIVIPTAPLRRKLGL